MGLESLVMTKMVQQQRITEVTHQYGIEWQNLALAKGIDVSHRLVRTDISDTYSQIIRDYILLCSDYIKKLGSSEAESQLRTTVNLARGMLRFNTFLHEHPYVITARAEQSQIAELRQQLAADGFVESPQMYAEETIAELLRELRQPAESRIFNETQDGFALYFGRVSDAMSITPDTIDRYGDRFKPMAKRA